MPARISLQKHDNHYKKWGRKVQKMCQLGSVWLKHGNPSQKWVLNRQKSSDDVPARISLLKARQSFSKMSSYQAEKFRRCARTDQSALNTTIILKNEFLTGRRCTRTDQSALNTTIILKKWLLNRQKSSENVPARISLQNMTILINNEFLTGRKVQTMCTHGSVCLKQDNHSQKWVPNRQKSDP